MVSQDPVFLRYHPTHQLWDVSFALGAEISFAGRNLSAEPDLVGFLKQHDPSARQSLGFMMFPNLGIMVSSFHDGDELHNAIVLSSRECIAFYDEPNRPIEGGYVCE